MKFEAALSAIREGKTVTRRAWTVRVYLDYQGALQYPVLVRKQDTVAKHEESWNVSQLDLLADDWEIVD